MAAPSFNYGAVGGPSFDSADPSVTGRVTGDSGAADIDHVNIWMRSTPWYQQILQQNGGNAKSPQAKAEIIKAAQQNGVQVDQGGTEIDDNGNFKTSGMSTWGKVLIVAGIAAASIATMGAAGVFAAAGAEGTAGTIGADAAIEAGVGGGAAAGAGAGAAAGGVLASTATGTGLASGITAAGVGAEGGLAGLGAAGAGAAGLGAAGAGAAGGAGVTGTGAAGALDASSLTGATAGSGLVPATTGSAAGGLGGLSASGGAAAAGGGLSTTQGLTAAGKVLSGIEAARAGGRVQQAGITNQANQTALAAAKLNLAAPSIRAHSSVQGDILAGLQPVSFSGPLTGTGGKMPTMSGGLTPSLLSANSRQLGTNMSRDALLSQMNGPAFTPTPPPTPNGIDTALNIGQYAGLAKTGWDLFNGA